MRIVMMHHSPLGRSGPGQLAWRWAQALGAAGNELRFLCLDEHSGQGDSPMVERIICRAGDPAADLPFSPPQFGAAPSSDAGVTFASLSDEQLTQYRDQLRRRLDAIIDRFDPHVLHAQHIWLFGQLALETGVPYVLNAWDIELDEYEDQARYRSLVDQAAENAGRILAPNADVAQGVLTKFDGVGDRTVVMPAELTLGSEAASAEGLLEIYQAVLDERFGDRS